MNKSAKKLLQEVAERNQLRDNCITELFSVAERVLGAMVTLRNADEKSAIVRLHTANAQIKNIIDTLEDIK